MSAQMGMFSQSMGGPAEVFASAGAAGGGGVRHDGQLLVDLIQQTIAPDIWDING